MLFPGEEETITQEMCFTCYETLLIRAREENKEKVACNIIASIAMNTTCDSHTEYFRGCFLRIYRNYKNCQWFNNLCISFIECSEGGEVIFICNINFYVQLRTKNYTFF